MKLIKRRNLNNQFPAFFDDFFTKDFFDWDRDHSVFSGKPAVNIIDKGDAWSIEVAVPGLSKEDFNVELENDLLTISFETKEEKEESGKYTRREFRYNSFKRSFTVPKGTIIADEIDAKYENGILTLLLPKVEEAKPKAKRSIAIG